MSNNSLVFNPDRNRVGFLSLFTILVICISAAGLLIFALFSTEIPEGIDISTLIIVIPGIVISLIGSILVLIVLLSLSHMRYELRDDALYLMVGPWKNKILYSEIVEVVNKDLFLNPISSFRMPGIALFNVLYLDEGVVRMYSTHALKDIVLIKTLNKKYGISPKDKEEFINDLLEKTGKEREYLREEIVKEKVKEAELHVLEPKRRAIAQISSFAITIICIIISLVYYPRLPQMIVVHWGIAGIPNGYMTKILGISIIPVLMVSFTIFPFFFPDDSGTFRTKWYKGAVLFLLASLFEQMYILWWNTGIQINGKVFFPIIFIIITISVLITLKLFLSKNIAEGRR